MEETSWTKCVTSLIYRKNYILILNIEITINKPAAGLAKHFVSLVLAALHVDVLLERVQVQQGKQLVQSRTS